MSTTVKQIETMARQLLADEKGGATSFKAKDDIYPWLTQGRTELRSLRPSVALSSDSMTVTVLTPLTLKTQEINEPDRFALALAYYVAHMCLSTATGDRKNDGKSRAFRERFNHLAKTVM